MAERLVMESAEEKTGADGKPVKRIYKLFESDAQNPEIYIDGMQGVIVVGSVVKINCFTRGHAGPTDGATEERRMVACRLTMGVDTFLAILDWLKVVDADLRPKILITSPPQEKS